MDAKKILIGSIIIAILIIIISQIGSALTEKSWPKYDSSKWNSYSYKNNHVKNIQPYIDTRTSKEKYYYNYDTEPKIAEYSSSWGNKRVFNTAEYIHQGNETYTTPYYYKPRYSQITDSYNWRF